MKKKKIISLFDGDGGARLALPTHIGPYTYYRSEIDKYANAVHHYNFNCHNGYDPSIDLGDVMKLNDIWHEFMDDTYLIIGGSPCTNLSIAKQNREGLEGEQSRLFWQYVLYVRAIRPKYFFLENVASMSKDDQRTITKTLGVQPIKVNSARHTAQNRVRWYWTNIPHNFQLPPKKDIFIKDILETDGIEVFRKGKKTKLRMVDKSFCLDAAYGEKIAEPKPDLCNIPNQAYDYVIACAKRTRTDSNRKQKQLELNNSGKANSLTTVTSDSMYCLNVYNDEGKQTSQQDRIYDIFGKTPALVTHNNPLINDVTIRKYTVREAARLQGKPEWFSYDCVSKTQALKILGNGFQNDTVSFYLNFME
jgi:DNA-cytosine methyltransferase